MYLPKNDLLKKSFRSAAHFGLRAVICYLGAENMRKALLALTIVLTAVAVCFAQTETATVSGRVLDKSSAAVAGAEIVLTNVDTNAQSRTKTGKEGLYVFAGVMPGRYRLAAGAAGFSVTVKNDLVVHVQDEIAENFTLQVGSVNEVVTVSADAININTTDASVSTVVDQTYIKNMPLNGRSFQDLILLTPGIVTQTPQNSGALSQFSSVGQTGEFSVNGQRPEENYYTVDGVSANLGGTSGSSLTATSGASGSLPASTALGTTQALVSVDDLQEFRVQSSTYSAEYGRTPGGQFAFETKSGTNQWHGTAYDYLRNDYFDANDWFNNYLNAKEPPLRQNDFGGTLGGPIRIPHVYDGKDKTFFFVSYEGLRLIQPQEAEVSPTPDLCFRGTGNCPAGTKPAPAELQPLLQAFPLPNRPDIGDGWAQFKGSWSNPNSIDSTSVRFDHLVTDKMRLFFRFSDTNSNSASRLTYLSAFGLGAPPTNEAVSGNTTRTYTGGATSILTNRLSNEFRLNYSSNEVPQELTFVPFAGSKPVDLAQLTGLGANSFVSVDFFYDNLGMQPAQGKGGIGRQKQWNLVDTVSYSTGRHELKFGIDYRRFSSYGIDSNPQMTYFYCCDPTSVQNNTPLFDEIFAEKPAYPLYKNFSAFVEDQWKASRRLSLTLGLRWEVNPPPGATKGLMPYTVQGSTPDTYAVAPQGTPLWKTTWYNLAPRLGAAYVIRDRQGWETVARAGGGVFFDTGQQSGSQGFFGPGFIAANFPSSGFPQAPPIPVIYDPTTPQGQPYQAPPSGFAHHLQLPYSVQWNGALEQALGKSQALTLTYVGMHAAKLLRLDAINAPNNPNSTVFDFTINGLTSDYDSGQAEFRRRLNRGLTALASYTWSHCIDYGSQNYYLGYQRGSCDFDVRHNFSGAFSYDVPNVSENKIFNAVLHHWGLDDRFIARTAFPVSLDGGTFVDPATGKQLHSGLDLVANQPLYVYGGACNQLFAQELTGPGCPGGRAINANAFTNVPMQNNQPTRTGTAPRNFARGFSAWQMNMAVRREFPIYERLKLQFRAEAFNIFNHPNFGVITPFLCQPDPTSNNGCNFGLATATLANSLGTLSSLYQMGGPRSMQFALKAIF
jgi:hypothetical protein